MDTFVNGSLLILGNGFDVNCGLKSSFESFFGKSHDQNLWYKIFNFVFSKAEEPFANPIFEVYKKTNILWMDVESCIKNVLFMNSTSNFEKGRLKRIFGFDSYISILQLAFNQRFNSIYLYDNYQFCEFKRFFMSRFDNNINSIDIVDYLSDELIRFEEEFKTYIARISQTDEYKKKSAKILGELIDDGEEAFDILTFNYTIPDQNAVSFFAYNNINHVHGIMNDKVIIGYDSSDISEINDNRIKMSKAIQKMFYKTSNVALPEKDQVLFLKFYGHSLSSQDYSYFHSIFDYYEIYHNGKISLVFYYTPYHDTKEENDKWRNEYIGQVYNLLNSYSLNSSIHNEKSNVIVSKLLLENRLFIRKIPKL